MSEVPETKTPELSELDQQVVERRETVEEGGAPKYHERAGEVGKLFVRERIKRLLDAGLEVEDGAFANVLAGDLPADGVVTGIGKIGGRRVAIIANDSTVK